ncbi:centromere F, putative [Babesia ovata]|uniref:Centromere F, putative n=1 Tax=Babesia ovata TaxID=189622 RepID=A0A2H6K839_9APIC|nr:centromere F, putative [Babesia ovata]GBE59150.1 centromere F, putative [Babesia ovata]
MLNAGVEEGAHSPVFGGRDGASTELPLAGLPRYRTIAEAPKLPAGEGAESVQLPEGALMGIIFNLEQERETYLEAVAVLHQQLLEAQEHCQQLSDSHEQIRRNLEAEVSEGWKEAEIWEARYRSVEQVAKCIGLDVAGLQKPANTKLCSSLEVKPTNRAISLNSDACTVVTIKDLHQTAAQQFNAESPRGARLRPVERLESPYDDHAPAKTGVVVRATSALESGNSILAEDAHSKVKDSITTWEATSSALSTRDVDRKGVHESSFTATLPKNRVLGHRKEFSIFRNSGDVTTEGFKPRRRNFLCGNSKRCCCSSPAGAPCSCCGSADIAPQHLTFTDPSTTNYHGWVYLNSPRTLSGRFDRSSMVIRNANIGSTLSLVFEATDF